MNFLPVQLKARSQNPTVPESKKKMPTQTTTHSPIDDSVVWTGQTSTADQVDSVMKRADEAARSWREVSVEARIEVVHRYGDFLKTHQAAIAELIGREVGKLPWDARAETNAAIAKVALSVQAFKERRGRHMIREKAVDRVVRFHPLGVVLVLGPFNFPLHLPGGQIIPALLAGNAVVFKPSDQAHAVGELMMKAWQEAGLPDGVLQIITGGTETAVTAIDSPSIDGVFLTGSRTAGRAIHRQLAGRPDVLLALELGGNNPIVVADTDAEMTASIVTFSAFVSSGQRCTCARRAIFISDAAVASRIDAVIAKTAAIRVGLPGDTPMPQVGPMISATAANALRETYQDLLAMGCKSVIAPDSDSRRENLLRPAIVDATDLADDQHDRLGEMEWFGPLLVIERVDDFDAAIRRANRTPYGLAAALLGGSRELFERFVNRVGAGVVNWNRPTTGAAGTLPFGGLSDSGNHRPAGFHAIDFCNDPVASLEAETLPDEDPWNMARETKCD